MSGKGKRDFYTKEATEFLNHVMADRPLFPFLVPLVLVAWAIERWVLPLSNWVPLVVSVWATIQYGRFQRQLLVDDLNKRWKQVILKTSPMTPLEQCEWLNKFLMEVWPNFINPKLSKRFSSIVVKRLKHRKPRLIERVELQEFSLGSCPPNLGLQGTRWITSGDQLILRMGFEWDTNDINIMLLAKLAKPLLGTARIFINSMHIKGDLCLMPILDGQAVLYSFESIPDVRLGIAFGSGSQSLPATEVPGVSSWLVKLLTDTLVKAMVEPRRRCFSLPPVDLNKKAVGGIISVTVISASSLVKGVMKGSNSGRQNSSIRNGTLEGSPNVGFSQAFVEVELGQLTRKTNASPGSDPRWDVTFNMVFHEDSEILRFHLYEFVPNSVRHDHIASCELKVKYVADDSTIYWAVGPGSSVLAKRVESLGQEVEFVVPFEGMNSGELNLRLVLREWHFSDGSSSLNYSSLAGSHQSRRSSSNFQPRTGRKLKITVLEGKDLMGKDKFGKCSPYVKLQYGKALYRTSTISHVLNPAWNHKFEFDEIGGGEYLKIKCFGQDTFSDDSIGSARVNLEGLVEGSMRDIWVPLEKVNTGEIRLQLEAVKNDDCEGSRGANGGLGCGWIELVLIEAKDLIAADLRGTSDPYVRVQYGSMKKRTKVMYRTLHPQWNQILEFPDDGSSLLLNVMDHNAVLPTSSIGHCIVEYLGLAPNQMAEKWIPLQGVKKGEIHIQVTRKIPELQKKPSLDSNMLSLSKAHQMSGQMRQITSKFQTLIDDEDLEGLSEALSEIESLQDVQEEYLVQLETEETLLINKINELGQEIYRSSPSSNMNKTLSMC